MFQAFSAQNPSSRLPYAPARAAHRNVGLERNFKITLPTAQRRSEPRLPRINPTHMAIFEQEISSVRHVSSAPVNSGHDLSPVIIRRPSQPAIGAIPYVRSPSFIR